MGVHLLLGEVHHLGDHADEFLCLERDGHRGLVTFHLDRLDSRHELGAELLDGLLFGRLGGVDGEQQGGGGEEALDLLTGGLGLLGRGEVSRDLVDLAGALLAEGHHRAGQTGLFELGVGRQAGEVDGEEAVGLAGIGGEGLLRGVERVGRGLAGEAREAGGGVLGLRDHDGRGVDDEEAELEAVRAVGLRLGAGVAERAEELQRVPAGLAAGRERGDAPLLAEGLDLLRVDLHANHGGAGEVGRTVGPVGDVQAQGEGAVGVVRIDAEFLPEDLVELGAVLIRLGRDLLQTFAQRFHRGRAVDLQARGRGGHQDDGGVGGDAAGVELLGRQGGADGGQQGGEDEAHVRVCPLGLNPWDALASPNRPSGSFLG